MNPTDERWRRLEAIFHELSEAPDAERSARLESLCEGDGELQREARSLLSSSDDAERLRNVTAPPRRVGPYELERLLGQGGWGAVYLARRVDGQFEQQVAVKLIGLPLVTNLFKERFRQERQILARLSHPFIARLLDGGVSEGGELYLAMEFADGLPIDLYCSQHALPIRARIKLFRSVCTAVRFAHQNLVIHRDLKPDNLLVLEDGTPKLLDFGIAKLISPMQQEAEGEFTRLGVRSFTPQYASPEQVLGGPISTASDIYSLGVLLYVLTAGAPPYELKEFSTAELVRVVCEQEPPKPSERAALDSDIDAIVMKAMRKEPEARYASVDQLITDLEAYLDGQPVAAHAGSFRYGAGKFIRRNKVAFVAAALLLATMLAGIGGVLWQFRIARAERRIAESRAEDLRKLSNSLLSEIDEAIQKLPGSTAAQKLLVSTVLEHLDRTARDATGDPQLQLDLANGYTRLANVQGNPYDQNIGDTKGALASLDKAISIATALTQKQPGAKRTLGWSRQSRAEVLFGMGRTNEAVASMRQAIAAFDELASRPDANVDALTDAGVAYGGLGDELGQSGTASLSDLEGALAAFRRNLEIDERILTLEPRNLRALRGVAIAHTKIGNVQAETDPGAAQTAYRQAIDGMSALPAEAKSTVSHQRIFASILRRNGMALKEIGRYQEALSYMQQARAILQPLLIADPNDTRAGNDMLSTLENEAECFEDRQAGIFPEAHANRNRDAASALSRLAESRLLIEQLLRIEPKSSQRKSMLGLILIGMSLQQRALQQPDQGLDLAGKGAAILEEAGHRPDASAFDLDQVATGLSIVEPARLRNPVLAVNCAERMVAIGNRRKPSQLLTLAVAYRAAGEAGKARLAAQEGLALLPAETPATIPSRIRKQLRWQMNPTGPPAARRER